MARLYLRQLLAGRDFGAGNPVAAQMQNFVYLVGDRDTGECLVVDPAWDIPDLVRVATADDMKIVGALATHYHPDHVGGTMYGFTVEGLPTLMETNPCKCHVHHLEADGVRQVTGLSKSDLVTHYSGDKVEVGGIAVELLHTPGHPPGSQCFRVADALLAGDTLLLQGCGPHEMRITLTQRLDSIPDDVVLFPGHAYGGENALMGHVRRTNPYLQLRREVD